MNINEITQNIVFAAESIWDLFLRAHADELQGRKGGVLQLIPLPTATSLSSVEDLLSSIREVSFGVISDEKRTEKTEFARKKIKSLLTPYLTNEGYRGNYFGPLSSFEQEDEQNGIYGGGIITDTHIIAFSGFPPDMDQKFVILAAEAANNISKARVMDIWLHSTANEQKWIDQRIA